MQGKREGHVKMQRDRRQWETVGDSRVEEQAKREASISMPPIALARAGGQENWSSSTLDKKFFFFREREQVRGLKERESVCMCEKERE